MKILVADKFEKSGLDGLGALGEVVYEADLQGDALRDRIKETEAEVLVVRGTKVSGEMLEGTHLGLVIRAGAGYNTIDTETAAKNGIFVSNCPGKNAQAVAELAFGLIVAVDRKIPDNVAEFRDGKWNKKAFSKAQGLHGRTLGLVGLGNIGKDMIPRAKAFGMDVLVYSNHLEEAEANQLGVHRVSLDEIAKRSDIVSVHTSLRPETKGLLGEEFFSQMKEGAYFINTSRAEVIDQAALEKAIESKKLFAGLDVFDDEPTTGEGDYSGSLKSNARVYCTHHIGASTEQAQEAVASETVRIVEVFKATGEAPNAVNKPAQKVGA